MIIVRRTIPLTYKSPYSCSRPKQLISIRFKTTTKVLPNSPQSKNDVSNPNVRWFYASDVPISKPDWFHYKQTKQPESFIPFSEYDSNNLEREFKNKDKSNSKPIEVNEDKLFEVDVNEFQLAPVYWDGPIYEVRRGVWFDSDGKPLNGELTKELEIGFKKVKPYSFDSDFNESNAKLNKNKISEFNKSQIEGNEDEEEHEIDVSGQKDVYKLSNDQLVLYFNKNQAAIFPINIATDFRIDIIRYFGPNQVSLLGVKHIERGYSEKLKKSLFDKLPDNPLPGIADTFQNEFGYILGKDLNKSDSKNVDEISNESSTADNEIDDKHMQQYLEKDYDLETSVTKSNREIDHLILCVHGIGQVLGSKYESVNFTHNINVLRNTMKKVFEENDDYKKLAYPNGKQDEHNNRIQVLPISWRHRVDFRPQMTKKENKDSRLPTLSQINVDGIKALRNIFGDVVLDVLLYYQPNYLQQIFTAVISETNRVYKLFKEKNPNFNGKVHILGHSLGSAISFDILSGQSGTITGEIDVEKDLAFDVENLFLLGSPVGMFKLLEGKNIEARSQQDKNYQPNKESNIVSPKCQNLYNLFHPCDPIAYRVEPLVAPKFGDFKAVPVEFAVKGLNSQIKDLANLGDDISEKISSAVKWLSLTQKQPPNKESKSIEEKAQNENALGDIISSVIKPDGESEQNDDVEPHERKLTSKELVTLTALNDSGRIDYSLPMGVLDISLVSAVSAHISYYEDENTAGFIMKEVLSKNQKPVTETVTLY